MNAPPPPPPPPHHGGVVMFQPPPSLQQGSTPPRPPPLPLQGGGVMFRPPPSLQQGAPLIYQWQAQDQNLKKAALNGDVQFMIFCRSNNAPSQYYFTLFQGTKDKPRQYGNILHLAVLEGRIEFIRQVITVLLPSETTRYLLLQPRSPNNLVNALHLAGWLGSLKIVSLILNFYKSLLPSLSQNEKPWLALDHDRRTPCHLAARNSKEDCALAILQMDMQSLTNTVDITGCSLMYDAVYFRLNKLVLAILNSGTLFSHSGFDGYNPLHCIIHCSPNSGGHDILKLLLERKPDLVKERARNGLSVLHSWAREGKLWPFDFLINSSIRNYKREIADLMSTTDDRFGQNPLHTLALNAPIEKDAVKIAKLLIQTYRSEKSGNFQFPWLMRSFGPSGSTPLMLSIKRGYQTLALLILSEYNNYDELVEYEGGVLVFAIQRCCLNVAEMILDKVDEEKWTQLVDYNSKTNALHAAPMCRSEEFLKRLLDGNPKLISERMVDEGTIIHAWLVIGELWPFKYFLESPHIDGELKRRFVNLFSAANTDLNNPFHFAALYYKDTMTIEIIDLLVAAYKRHHHEWRAYSPEDLPWFVRNKNENGPLHIAIFNQNQTLAIHMLSLFEGHLIEQLLDYYEPENNTLLHAIEKNCYQVAENIMERLIIRSKMAPPTSKSWTTYLVDQSGTERNVLHLAPRCKDQSFGLRLVEQAPNEFINMKDRNGKTPFDEAFDIGADWIIPAMMQKDPELKSAPLAWVQACKNGHTSTIRVFIQCYQGRFKDHCIRIKDSPLHHIEFHAIADCEEFLKIPCMADLINVQDKDRASPLHIAIRKRNLALTETLLKMDKIMFNITDNYEKTARGLLEELYEQEQWKNMCKGIEFDPRVKTSFFQRRTNFLEVRSTLSVVASLLATITFTAGFTLPGGLDEDSGEALLANKAVFVVFLISDTLAMCSSMLVLIFLIWSMGYESDKSLSLIDRTIRLQMLSLVSTVVAFMSGVFVVISKKSPWAAIVVILMCSLGISAYREFLYILLPAGLVNPISENGERRRICSLELGKFCSCCRISHHQKDI